MKTILYILLFSCMAIFSVNAQMQTDYSDSKWSIVVANATLKSVDMKTCIAGKYVDYMVSDLLKNTGSIQFRFDSIYFEGTDKNFFSVISGNPPYELAPNESASLEFRFSPISAKLYTATIVAIIKGDTLKSTIIGKGIAPQILVVNEIIDFGKVYLGKDKDTLNAVTIKNIGSAPITITSTKHSLPNNKDFTTKKGGGSFTLLPDSLAVMDLNFKPSSSGLTNGNLEFYYDGEGSPAVIQLYGEGINTAPRISTELTPFENLICQDSVMTGLKIKNIGGQDLVISELSLSGTNENEFKVLVSPEITIEPDNSSTIPIVFYSKDKGVRTAELLIKSNSNIDSELTIPLTAVKDSIILESDYYNIDLGYLCSDTIKDTTIYVTNTGTISSYYTIDYSASLSSTINKFSVIPNERFEIPIKLNTKDLSGAINEYIEITDTLCLRTINIQITGQVSDPDIKLGDLKITAVVGSNNEGELLITNNSQYDVSLTKPSIINSKFEIVSPTFPILIDKNGSSVRVRFNYTPDDMINDTCNVQFEFSPCNALLSADIIGIPTSSSALFEIKNVSAYAGQEISVPITLVSQQNLEMTGISGINAKFYFNHTLLAPLDYQATYFDKETSFIDLQGLPLIKTPGEVLTNLRFIAGLGNSVSSKLKLEDINAINGTSDFKVQNAEFTLLGICTEGGLRLINPDAGEVMKKIIPNPASNTVNLQYQLSEKGYTELTIVNSVGIEFKKIVLSGADNYLLQSMNIDLTEFSNGVYYLIVKTPATVESKSIMILK